MRFFSFNSYAQVGINTNTPDPSAELEIYSDDKGMLLPSYVLTDLNSAITPVANPQEGALIFNTGGMFIRGIYYWDGASWNRFIVNNEIDQILNLQIAGVYTSSNDESKRLIPSGTANNYISFSAANETKYINTMGIANPTGENISLPAGTYKVDVSVDCISYRP
ncbi:hypothetical protein QWY92_07910 [Algibacter miyuki]|uniref:hypothetical protein n=1 Tax=Algibacter miyuki TaxID=1306933 RepID=UPI0025B5C57F|nr:hypothetical protein [Algibacter miyuki]MDN3665334.1 hypothetical protein [Algibacter miyuki]